MKRHTNCLWAPMIVLTALNARAAEPVAPANSAVPNLVGQVSQRLLSHLVNTPVENTTNITDNILGTSVRGSVKTQGQIFPLLVPSANQGVLQLRFSGTSRSPGLVGQNGPATIYSSSVTNSNMWKTVLFDEKGIRHLPTDGQAQTRVNINGVSANRPLVELIARRRANGSRGQAQAITSAKTKGRLKQEIDRGAKEPLLTAQDYFVNEFQKPLRERGALPKLLRFSTTSDHLRLAMQQLGRSEMPLPTSTPELKPQHDLTFALHGSAVNSLYEVFYAGETVRDKDWLQTMDTLTGDEPAPLRIKAGTPRWSVTLADKRPLDLSFGDGGVAVALHVKTLKLGERKLDGKFTISVRYQLEKTSNGPVATRQEEVQVEGELDSGSAAERDEAVAHMKAKFAGVFLPTLSLGEVAPPSDDLWSKLGKLLLVELDAKDGWLVAGYQLPAPKTQLVSRPAASDSRVASYQPTSTAPRVTKQDLDTAEAWLTKASVKHQAAKKFLPHFQRMRSGGCH